MHLLPTYEFHFLTSFFIEKNVTIPRPARTAVSEYFFLLVSGLREKSSQVGKSSEEDSSSFSLPGEHKAFPSPGEAEGSLLVLSNSESGLAPG